MRALAVLAIMIAGFALLDRFALGGSTSHQIERDTAQTATALRIRAETWAEQFSR